MIAGGSLPVGASRVTAGQEAWLSAERSRGEPVLITPFAVGFYFSFRAIIVLVAARLFLLEPSMGAAASLTTGFLLLIVAAFQSIGPSAQSLVWLLRVPSFRWVSAFVVFAGCSLAWSGTVSLPNSFVYWCGLATDVVLVVALLRVNPVLAIAHSLLKGFIWSTCMLAMIAWIMPTGPDLRLGDLDYFNTNQIGNLCAFAVLLAQYLMVRKDGKWQPAIIFLVVTLVRSLSKTTLVAFLVCEVYFVARDQSISRKVKMSLLGAALAVTLIFWGLFVSYYSVYTTSGNQAQTLTGRVAIWTYSLNAAIEKPWIGNGFDSMWKVFPPFGEGQFEARHAENELLQQFFAYGMVGIVLLCGLYGSLFRQIRRLPRESLRIALLSLLLFIVVRGFAEAEPFDLLLPLWAITLIGSIVADTLCVSQPLPGLRGASRNPAGIACQVSERSVQ